MSGELQRREGGQCEAHREGTRMGSRAEGQQTAGRCVDLGDTWLSIRSQVRAQKGLESG